MKRFPKMIIIFVSALALLSVVLYAFAPHAPAAPKQVNHLNALDEYFNQLTASGNPPGMSVVVVKNGEVVYQRAFGYADGPRKLKATSDTVYHWWSMTKIPTAIAILQLQEQGRLTIEDEVTKHLPWFEVQYPSGEKPAITIHHLLQHASGLPDTMPSMMGWVHYEDVLSDQTELVKKYLPQFSKLKFVPGEKSSYSNLNFMVLGAVIEAVTGQTYESYIMENILKPLGMTQTDFLYNESMAGNAAAGSLPVVHLYTPLLPFLLDTNLLIRERMAKLLWLENLYVDATPPTGLIGSASDIARFMRMYLKRGSLEGELILSPESISLLTDAPPLDSRGLGWLIGESNGYRYLEHGGGGPGFATIMRIYPENDLGIAILANGTDLDRSGLTELLANMDW